MTAITKDTVFHNASCLLWSWGLVFLMKKACSPFFVFFLADGTLKVISQFISANACPSDLSGRVARHQGVIRHIFCHDCPGADEGVTADSMAADDRGVGPDGGTFFDKGGPHLVHLGYFRPWVEDVGEDHRGAAEDAVFDGNAFIDADIVLDFALVPDGGVGADDDILADVAVLADFRAGENVGEVPDFGAFADLDVIIDDGGWVDEDPFECGGLNDVVLLFFLPCLLFFFEGMLADLQYF